MRHPLKKLVAGCALLGLFASGAQAAASAYLYRVPIPGLIASSASAASFDPYFSSVAALLPLNSGSSLVDAKGGTWTGNNVSMSSAQAKVGNSSLAFTTSTSWVTGPAISLTGDFTVELWVYPTSISSTSMVVAQWSQQTPSVGGWGVSLIAGVPNFSLGAYSVGAALLAAGSVSGNTWSHLAFTRQGSTFREFVNGSLVQTATFSGAGRSLSIPTTIGNYYGFNGQYPASGVTTFQGYVQQLRITNGVARYTSSFIPSSSPDPTQ